MSENIHYFLCNTCKSDEPLSHTQVVEHLKQVHKLTDLKGTRQLTIHADEREWYSSQYAWKIGGVELTEVCKNKRAKNDMMRFAA